MVQQTKKIREIYLTALKISPQIYRNIWPILLVSFLVCVAAFFIAQHHSLIFAAAHPLPVLLFFFLFSVIAFGYISSYTFATFYQENISPKIIFSRFLKLQKKWWGGMLLLLLPAFISIGLSELGRFFTLTHPYFALTAFFIATMAVCWSLLYLPVYFVYLGALFIEPNYTIRESIRFASNLCCKSWWRIVLSSITFYFLCFSIYDFSSSYYLRHDNAHVFLANITIMNFMFYCLFPLIAAFNTTLVDDLRLRNTFCDR